MQSVYRSDYLTRMIEQLGSALARALGLSESDPLGALDELQAARRALPFVPGVLENSNAREIAAFVPAPEVLLQLAHLERLEGVIRERQPETSTRALACYKRAAALFVEAARSMTVGDEDRACFRPVLEKLAASAGVDKVEIHSRPHKDRKWELN